PPVTQIAVRTYPASQWDRSPHVALYFAASHKVRGVLDDLRPLLDLSPTIPPLVDEVNVLRGYVDVGQIQERVAIDGASDREQRVRANADWVRDVDGLH